MIILSVVLLSFGFSAFNSDKKSKTNLFFLLFIVFAILWIFSNYFSNVSTDYWFVLYSNRSIFISTTLLAWALLMFISVYPESDHVISPKWRTIAHITTLIVVLLDFTECVVSDVIIEKGFSSIDFGSCISIYVIHFVLFFILFIYVLIKKYKESKGIEKRQLQYLLLGVLFTALGALITNLILPIFLKIFFLSNYGPAFLVIFIGFISVSIVRHRFLSIRFLLGRILYYALLSIVTLIGYYVFSGIAEISLGGIFSTQSILLSLLLAPIYAILFLKISDYIRKVIENKLVYVRQHPAEVISKFLKSTSIELDMDKIAVHVINTVKKYLNLDRAGVIIFDKNNSKIIFRKLIGFDLKSVRDLLQVINYWEDIGEDPIMVLDEVIKLQEKGLKDPKKRLERIIKCMEGEKISVILPLNRKVQLNGILIIGNKRDSNALSLEDMNFLEDIIANASVAMGRAILYKEVQGFNDVLKIKVAEQTKDLKVKVDQLNEARSREHDMVDIMGHELRTPMTIIKNYHELIRQLSKNKRLDKKAISVKKDGYMEIIGKNIEKEITLINTLLSATKLEDGHMVLNKEEVDIVEYIKDAIFGHEKEAKEKGLYIKFKEPQIPPKVYADPIRVHEIIDNFVSNAVKYTVKGGVEIILSSEKSFVKVDIIDTGMGMSKKDMKNIGKKFYRSNQYLRDKKESGATLVRPGGTGLGLFVTFGLVKAHGGKVGVKSTLGEGSTFTFTLPIMKKSSTKLKKKESDNGNMFERLGLKR